MALLLFCDIALHYAVICADVSRQSSGLTSKGRILLGHLDNWWWTPESRAPFSQWRGAAMQNEDLS